jgi:heptosyltransferase-2
MKQKPVLLHSTALTNLVSVIKRSSLFIGHSTGPMHIAAALKVPVVAIFGSVHPLDSFKEWGPWDTASAVVSVDLGCKNCHPTDCKTFDCMRLVKPQDVLKAAEALVEIP